MRGTGLHHGIKESGRVSVLTQRPPSSFTRTCVADLSAWQLWQMIMIGPGKVLLIIKPDISVITEPRSERLNSSTPDDGDRQVSVEGWAGERRGMGGGGGGRWGAMTPRKHQEPKRRQAQSYLLEILLNDNIRGLALPPRVSSGTLGMVAQLLTVLLAE